MFLRHHANLRRLLQGTENRLQETPARLLLSKVIHVLTVGLWFGTLVFFMVVGVSLYGSFEKEASKEANERPLWLPLAKPYDAARPSEKFPDPVRKEQGTRAAGFAASAATLICRQTSTMGRAVSL